MNENENRCVLHFPRDATRCKSMYWDTVMVTPTEHRDLVVTRKHLDRGINLSLSLSFFLELRPFTTFEGNSTGNA